MGVRVGLGTATFPFESAREYFDWVQLLEEGGVDSVWQSDRVLSSRPMLDAMSTMAALAGNTERIKFGMNAVVLSVRDPILLAKQCATIDYLSGGRVLPVFGIGGKHAPEFKRAYFEPKARGRRANEMLQIMQRLWTEKDVSFDGEFFQLERCTISPRPVQKQLPCWIGGHSKAAIMRTARYGTGWLGGLHTPAQVAPIIAAVKEALEVEGRYIDPEHFGAGFNVRFGSWDDPQVQAMSVLQHVAPEGFVLKDYLAVGEAKDIIARCRQYYEAGATKFVMMPMAFGAEDMRYQTERLIAEVIPAVEAFAD